MSTTNASAIFADALAQLSKAFTEIENQARLDILEARAERDKVAKNLHAATLEAQGWKQAAIDAKATVSQAELTIAHQAETIAELRQEVSQWKDQSRNWQDHFIRVEEERCAQSSRVDELLRLQYTRPINTALVTPKQKYSNVAHPSLSKQKIKDSNPGKVSAASSSQRQDDQTPPASHTTLIRHVQAVIDVKCEESDDDPAEDILPRRSRRKKAVVNCEEDDEDDEEEDELMMGAEENHEEVYGTQRVETLDVQRSKQRSKQQPTTVPLPKKKRKLAGRLHDEWM